MRSGWAQRKGERQSCAHGEPHDVGARDVEVIHQGGDVADQRIAGIGAGVVRLVAFAMAAQIERDAAIALALEGAVPAQPFPLLGAIGSEAVQQHDRPAVPRSDIVKGKRDPAGLKIFHPSSLTEAFQFLQC